LKKTLFIILYLLSNNLFAGTKDTTITGDLNHDNILDKITVSFSTSGEGVYTYLDGSFSVDINGSVINETSDQADVFDVKMVEIGPGNTNPAVLVTCYGFGDQGEYFFYSLKNNKIVSYGSIKAWGSAEVKGDGTVIVNDWMGFWSLECEYVFNNEANKFEMNRKDTYDVNVEGTVKTSFKLLKSRDDKSEVVQNLKSGTKVTLLKCDVKPVCKNADGYDDEYDCDWYLMRTAGGTEGWVRLKDFRENIQDLPWAG